MLFCTMLVYVAAVSCAFYDYRGFNATFLHDLGTIDAYLFPYSNGGVPDEVMKAAKSADILLTAYATSLLTAALYFRTHPSLLTTLTASLVGSDAGRLHIRQAQLAAFRQLIELVGAQTHLGKMLSDYANIMVGPAAFSDFVRKAVVMELEKMMREGEFLHRYGEGMRRVELEYERRMMDVLLEGTAGVRELQTPFLMMAAGMKLVHDRAGLRDRIPEGLSPQGSQLNATAPHNGVEASLHQKIKN